MPPPVMTSQPKDQFALARERAAQRASNQASQSKEALKRRFAQLGSLQGGERIKMEQQADDQAQRVAQEANEGIDAAEIADVQRRREVEEGREFAKSERLGSQEFAGQQAELGRAYGTKEREASQLFASGEAGKQRDWSTVEREKGQLFAAGEALKQRDWGSAERMAGQDFAAKQSEIDKLWQSGESEKARVQQKDLFNAQMGFEKTKFDEQIRQFNESFGEEQTVNAFNMKLAEKIAGEKGFFESLTGGGIFGGGGGNWASKLAKQMRNWRF